VGSGQSPVWLPWLFGFWCLAAMASDLVSRRIPNWLTYPSIVLGVFAGYLTRGPEGIWDALGGILVAIPFALLFFLRLFGGGDVKFMAAIGAWLGFYTTLNVALSAVLLGAAMGAITLIWQGRLLEALRRESSGLVMRASQKTGASGVGGPTNTLPRDQFPFGVPLGLCALFWMGPVLG
jgi:prepilin peptidase CpaA